MLSDLKYAWRQLRKSPGFALTAVVTLALGIGANTAIFSVMHAVLLRMLPVHDPQQLFYLTHETAPDVVSNTGDYRYCFGINVYNRMRADRSVFADLVAYVPLSFSKVGARYGDTPEEIAADEVSGNFFSALGVPMAAGRAFASVDEDQHSQAAVIGYGFWTRRFQRDPSVIGKAIYVNGVPMTVIGVAGPHFYGVESGGNATDLWIPLQSRTELNAWGVPSTGGVARLYTNPNWWNLMFIARLRPGIGQKQALARMEPLFEHAAWETVGKEVKRGNFDMGLGMVPARGLGTATKDYVEPVRVLMGMVALVLVIACVNIAMLLAARNAAREREFSMRLALGAGRWPLFRQLLGESMLLVGAGAGLGWLFAIQATRLLAAWSGIEVSLAPDSPVLFFTLAITVFAALIFGLAPLRAASNAPVSIVLRSTSGQATESRGRVLSGKVLIAGQMALCVALLFGAGLLIRTLRNYQTVDLGMQADRVLAFGAHPVGAPDTAQKLTFYRQLIQRVGLLPGVGSVTVAELRPGTGWSDSHDLTIDGHSYPWDDGKNMLQTNTVGPKFFATLGIPMLAGRDFDAGDHQGTMGVAIVNETLVRRYLKGASPIGHTLGQGKGQVTIVGLVRDHKYSTADENPTPMAWYCYQQDPNLDNLDVMVRAAGDPMTLLPQIRRIVRELDPNAPVQKPAVLSAQFEGTYLMPTLFARLGAFFGGLAALLVAVGLYGTLAYRVSRRTVEIGVRMALGAPRQQVVWMILRDSLVLIAAGLVVGLPLAWFGSKLMASMLYKLNAHDPISFVVAGVGVLTVSLAAALLPARRAASVEPMQALRNE
ncbi:MAG TPA: ABC transporter permease [Acidobacteriaceae bacterium]|nr:ABC transporter permease [Acidobacteriaceae bacterium]